MGQFDLTIGAISIGTNLNFLCFGLVAMQFYAYFTARYKDIWWITALVYWLLCLDTFHTAVSGYMLWDYTITHFNDPAYTLVPVWGYSSTPIVTVLASTPVQLFLAYRIFVLTKNKIFTAIIVFTSLVQGLAGLGTGIGALWLSDVFLFYKLDPIAGVWFSAQVLCDILITSILCYSLSKNRTGYRQTDHVVDRLIRASVETAAIASIFCILDLAVFYGIPGTHLHVLFALPMGRIYSFTYLATLNARTSYRKTLNATTPGTWIPGEWNDSTTQQGKSSRTKPSSVPVNVPQPEQELHAITNLRRTSHDIESGSTAKRPAPLDTDDDGASYNTGATISEFRCATPERT